MSEKIQEDEPGDNAALDITESVEDQQAAWLQAHPIRESPYTKADEDLKTFRRDFLKDCQPKEYRRLARKGELEAHLQSAADEARRFAEILVSQGTAPAQAWQWAIRVKLLESEMD